MRPRVDGHGAPLPYPGDRFTVERHLHAEDVASMGVEAVVARARAVLGDGPTYISFDIDSLDPGFAPGTGTPEVGGLTPREALAILRGCVGLDFVGADVVEVAPSYDATNATAAPGLVCWPAISTPLFTLLIMPMMTIYWCFPRWPAIIRPANRVR